MIESLSKDKCIGCGKCVEICPMDVFRMDTRDGKSVIMYRDDCQTCFQCELECPAQAIKVSPFTREKVQAWKVLVKN